MPISIAAVHCHMLIASMTHSLEASCTITICCHILQCNAPLPLTDNTIERDRDLPMNLYGGSSAIDDKSLSYMMYAPALVRDQSDWRALKSEHT